MPRKQTVTVSLTSEQLEWLDAQEDNRSELVRQAIQNEYDLGENNE